MKIKIEAIISKIGDVRQITAPNGQNYDVCNLLLSRPKIDSFGDVTGEFDLYSVSVFGENKIKMLTDLDKKPFYIFNLYLSARSGKNAGDQTQHFNHLDFIACKLAE